MKVYISLKDNKLYVFQKRKALFMYMIWFINSARGSRFVVAPKVSAKTIKKKKKMCTRIWTCGFYWYKQTRSYVLTEGRNFKTFLMKEKYIISLDSCYLFTKKMLNTQLNVMLIVLMEFAYIIHSWTLQQIWWRPCNLNRWWIWQSVSL